MSEEYLTFQCRGTRGELEKDVGVVIKMRTTDKEIFCPYYDKHIADNCKATMKECVFEHLHPF